MTSGSLTSRLMVSLMAVAATLVPAMASAQSPLQESRAVFVGHSLLNYDMVEIVKGLAESKGLVIRRAAQSNVGTNIANNWRQCRRSAYPNENPWWELACDSIDAGTDRGAFDTLVITQVNNPIIDPTNSANLGSTPEDYSRFLDLFLSRNPSGRAFFYTQWEGVDSPWHKGAEWTTRIADELALFERIAQRIEEISRTTYGRSADVNIIPANLALRDLVIAAESGRFPGVTSRSQLFSDDVHMTPLGAYFLASVIYSSIYQQSPVGASGRTVGRWGGVITDLSPEMARSLQQFAWEVVSRYRGWSGGSARPRPPTRLKVD
jgi:hypothetical protein